MIKLIHTADVHLGVKLLMFGEKAEIQRKAVRDTFRRIVDRIVSQKIDILLIAGDLFDSHGVSEETISFVKLELNRLQKSAIPVVIIPGTHDAMGGKIWERNDIFERLDQTHVFRSPNEVKREYPELDLTVWAKANTSNKSTSSPLGFLKAVTRASRYNVAMAHGSLIIPGKYAKDDWPIDPQEIADSKMNYIALGHWHGTQDVSQGAVKAWYAGSPEITYEEGKGGLGAGHILEVTIDKGGTTVEPIRMSARRFEKARIDVSVFEDESELKEKILEGADPNLIRQIELCGMLPPRLFLDTERLEEELGEHFFSLSLQNSMHLRIEDLDAAMYPSGFISGEFVRLMKEKLKTAPAEEKKIIEQALQIGLAELEGKNVISI